MSTQPRHPPISQSTNLNPWSPKSKSKPLKMAKRLANLFHHNKQNTQRPTSESDILSMAAVQGDGETAFGGISVAPTVHSQQTLKASNRQHQLLPKEDFTKSPSSFGWKKLKELVGVNHKSPSVKTKTTPIPTNSNRPEITKNQYLDMAIRGRLDGVDCLRLPLSEPSPKDQSLQSTVSKTTISLQHDSEGSEKSIPPSLDFDPSQISFTCKKIASSPSDMISEMIWLSGGSEQPELILEGFNDDRWTLRLDSSTPAIHVDSTKPKSLVNEGKSSANKNKKINRFWNQLWGKDDTPPQFTPEEIVEDDLLEIAAACSVPVDLDEGTFIIDSPDHLRSIHELVAVPLQAQRFDNALVIFDKLLKGSAQQENGDSNLENLVGLTHHNIGLVHFFQERYPESLTNFSKAVESRSTFFSSNHPLVAVSLIRKGEAYLALEAFQDSLEAFQQVLAMIPLEQDAATRAKVLVHVGVAYFYLENHDKALESFVTALEIQRTWLDGPVRRQPIIYDASMTLSNMGRVYLKKKEYQLSYSCFEEAFVLQSTTFPKDHDIALYSLKSMALVLAKNHQLSEALPILHNMLSLLPSTGNDFIEVMGLIGLLQAKDLEFEKSSESLQKVLAWQKSHLFMSSPDKIALTQQIIERVEALDDGKVSIWV